MSIVIKTEAGFLSNGTAEFTWRISGAKRFKTVAEALSTRELLNVKRATVIQTAVPRRLRKKMGIDIFPDEEESF